jgi:hypothetical protein
MPLNFRECVAAARLSSRWATLETLAGRSRRVKPAAAVSVGVSLYLRHGAAANRVLHVAGCPAGTASLPSGLDFVAPFPNLENIRRQARARQIERSLACSRSDSCGPLGIHAPGLTPR